ncbi:S1C family serine protease [Candidatus Pelagibacter sp.]|uniref:S1C family serine protease n=1 Tax=Candidatus Pelagibacter sp. TaxID=2024849 RepID=UPI003F8348E5
MKKLLGIVVLGLLLSGNAYAKAWDVIVSMQNENGVIYKIFRPGIMWSSKKYDLAFEKARSKSQNYCKSYSKDSYSFYSEGKFSLAINRQGKVKDAGSRSVTGIIPDMTDHITGYWEVRFFCAENKLEARKLLNKANNVLTTSEFKNASQTLKGNIIYYANHSSPFTLKNSPNLKIVEKPKKQEPKKNTSAKDKFKAMLIEFGLKTSDETFVFSFNKDETGRIIFKENVWNDLEWKEEIHDRKIFWEATTSEVFEYRSPGEDKLNRVYLNFKDKIAYIKHKDKDFELTFFPPSNSVIVEKPKSTPDDDKIVPAGSGSGFFVSKDGHAITNYHVIEGCDINKLSFKGSQTEVKVLAVDKVNDIAILKSNAKPDVIFPVSNEDVSLLEDVIVAGFPLGKQISSAIKTHKGVVTALAGAGDNYSFFQTDATINQGNSGGPIINQKGNVVGIAVATWVEEGVQGVHFGIKSSTLKTFASANGLSFASPNFRDQSNKALGELITKGTVYVECHMTVAKIKKMIAQAENRKAFFKEFR